MVIYHNWPPHESASQPPPKNGWERLAEAQDEAKRNAQVSSLSYSQDPVPPPVPAKPVQYALVAYPQAPESKMEPVAGPFGYCFYHPQPAYIAAEPMYYAPAPVTPGHAVYHQAAAPAPAAKVEEKKAEPAPSPFGDPNTEYYCRELDGSWSLRTCTDIVKNCQPGFWQTNASSGWPVYYRQKA